MRVLKFTLLFFLLLSLESSAQTLIRATGGDGKYRESIWWLDFSDVELAVGETRTQVYNIDDLYTLQVIIDSIEFSGVLESSLPISAQRLKGYKSGDYGGDGLVKLYNIGVPNNGDSIEDRSQNTLVNALGMKYSGNYTCNGNEAKANFRIRAYAYLNGSMDPIDVGMVFASAETDEPFQVGEWLCNEYSEGTTNGTPWQVLETGFYDPEGYHRLIISNNGQTANTSCGFNGYEWEIGNSMLLYTKKINTTAVDPLKVNMEFIGGGNTAVALGFLLTSVDRGDAPQSYGIAENIFFSTVLGGTPPSDGIYTISTEGSLGSPNIVSVGEIGYENVPRLGDLAGDPDEYVSITNGNADKDDEDGVIDEDALVQPLVMTTRDTAFTIQFNATNIPGYDAYVNAWLDVNKNGQFDSEEFKSSTINSLTTLTYTWTDIPSTLGTTYLRLRIQSNVPGTSTGSADIRMGGETEDYAIKITSFVTGNVFNDLNGLKGGTPTIDGNPIFSLESSPLYVSVIKDGGYIAQVPVQADGSYEIGGIESAEYEFVLTTSPNSSTAVLGPDWVYVGENRGATPGHDSVPNGRISVIIGNNSPEVSEVNFGINKRPETDSKHTTIPSPRTGDTLRIGEGLLPVFTGSDLEDGSYENLTGDDATPEGVLITSLASNGVLYYKGIPVVVNQVIPSINVGELYLVLTGADYTSTSFTYAYIDHAGNEDLSPATYEVNWASLLPVKWTRFDAETWTDYTSLTWSTASETNNKGFEVERSVDGLQWENIAFVESKSENGNSVAPLDYAYIDAPFNGDVFYRLKQVDFSGEIAYSKIVQVSRNLPDGLKVYPNPASEEVYIEGLEKSERVNIYTSNGSLVRSIPVKKVQQLKVSLSELAKGVYWIEIIGKNQSVNSFKLIKY